MAGAPVTCVMHARVPMPCAAVYTRALAGEGVRVVHSASEGASADFIVSTSGVSVGFIVSPGSTLAPEAAARAAKMDASFRNSWVLFLGGAPASPDWVASPRRWLAVSGDANDAVRIMLAVARGQATLQPAERPAPQPLSAAALVDAVAAFPGVPSKEAAMALLCASGTLSDLACAPPHALAAVARLAPADAETLAAAFQHPSPLMLPAAVAYTVV